VRTLRLSIQQLLPEFIPVATRRLIFHDDLLPVVRDLVDDVLCALAELQLVKGADAVWCDADS
jgi:hypothetical protein